MILGAVTGDREITIPLDLLAGNQDAISIDAVVDTGFNGFLTLPMNVLHAAGALAAGTRRAELGDGSLVEMDVYLVRMKWHDHDREILALQAEAMPLVGMSLLWGSRVRFDAHECGAATIDLIP